MSSPPPQGPQPPPQAPPYAPYPPQGYPSQYPAQPPYYGGPAPPPRDSHTLVIILAVVVVFVAVLAVVGYLAISSMMNSPFTRVAITGVSWSINGPASSHFGPSPLTSCAACPITAFVGSAFTYTLTLTNSDTVNAHRVSNITVGTLFTLESVSPPLPVTVSPGNSASFVLTIRATTVGGTYTLTGTVTVT